MNTQTTSGISAAAAEQIWFAIKKMDVQDLWMAICRMHFQVEGIRKYGVELPTILVEAQDKFSNDIDFQDGLTRWANRRCSYSIENIFRNIPPLPDKNESMTMIIVGQQWLKKFIQVEGLIPALFTWYKETIEVQKKEAKALCSELNTGYFKKFGATPNLEDPIRFQD